METFYSVISILEKLKERYRQYLKNNITDVLIIQTEDEVYLEIIEIEMLKDGLEKQTINRINLDFIREDEDELFLNANDCIEVNARKLINDLSPYSIINTIDLFHREACEQISKKYNIFGIDK